MPPNDIVTYAVIDSATGVIHRVGQSEEQSLPLQGGSGLAVIQTASELDDTQWYWDGSDWQEYPARPAGETYWDGEEWIELPPRPNGYVTWDGTEWVDPRSETDVFNQLHQARLATSIPTRELFIRLAQYGAFPMAEVANYAFPPTVDEFLDLPAFSTAQHDLIKGGLKSWATISRAETRLFGPIHPDDPGDGLPYFIPWLATEKSITITDAQADEMFGVPVPPPLYTAP